MAFVEIFGDYSTMSTVTNEDKETSMDDMTVQGTVEAFISRCDESFC